MPPVIISGNIIQSIIQSTVDGQICLNVLHYRVDTVDGGNEYYAWMDELNNALTAAGGIVDRMQDCVSTDVVINQVRSQRVYNSRDPYKSKVDGRNGALLGATVAPNLAACITKRSNVVGRGRAGRFELAGLPASVIEGGVLTADYQTTLEPLSQKLKAVVNLDPLGTLVPVIPYVQNLGSSADILETLVQRTVRTMHRRTVGLGQ